MKINREKLIGQLESVMPGLSSRELMEQSSCFVFDNDMVMTFNDEIACSHKCILKITGAVQAAPLLAILKKFKKDVIEMHVQKDELKITEKNRKCGIKMEAEILLPVASIKMPKKWKALPDKFSTGLSLVQECAGSDETRFAQTCIHLTKKWLEACDNKQAARYKIDTPIKESILIRKESLKHIVNFGMTKFGETKTWIHFKNPTGLILSCRRFEDEFKSITKILKVKGKKVVLPRIVKDETESAEVFSSENGMGNTVTVELKPSKMKIIGQGATGHYSGLSKCKYKGKELTFTISPDLLRKILEKDKKCLVTDSRLKVTLDNFQYITVLGAPK
jgi:DNA polymerase III sliding clamp (beta) subunit (PCNA family)